MPSNVPSAGDILTVGMNLAFIAGEADLPSKVRISSLELRNPQV